MIAWLTLAASLMVTGDLVIDLAFEETEVQTAADTASQPEAPDNAAEHILMPSQKGGSLFVLGHVDVAPAPQTMLIAVFLSSPPSERAGRIHERPPRSSPIPRPLPLRI